MGFGILFVGYLISLNSIAYPGFTKIIGYLVMLLAMTRLGQYNRHLRAAAYTLLPAALAGLAYLFIEVGAMFSLFGDEGEFLLFRIVPLAAAVVELFYLYYLMKGLQALAVETDVKVLEIAAFRNRLFTVACYILYIIGQLDYGAAAARFLVYYNLILLLVSFLIYFLNAKLIFSFYMWICLPEDIDMKRKPSRFALVERLLSRLDAIEEKSAKRRREADAAYREQATTKKKGKKKK